jgi:hypothetical protein
MKRSVASLVWLLAALPIAHAVPARLPYDPAPLKNPYPFELCGSWWFGSDSETGDWEIRFEKDGKITYSYKGRTFHNGSWQIKGDALYFETNNKYYEFHGACHGNLIDGESSNINGIRWHTSMHRIADSK